MGVSTGEVCGVTTAGFWIVLVARLFPTETLLSEKLTHSFEDSIVVEDSTEEVLFGIVFPKRSFGFAREGSVSKTVGRWLWSLPVL